MQNIGATKAEPIAVYMICCVSNRPPVQTVRDPILLVSVSVVSKVLSHLVS